MIVGEFWKRDDDGVVDLRSRYGVCIPTYELQRKEISAVSHILVNVADDFRPKLDWQSVSCEPGLR